MNNNKFNTNINFEKIIFLTYLYFFTIIRLLLIIIHK